MVQLKFAKISPKDPITVELFRYIKKKPTVELIQRKNRIPSKITFGFFLPRMKKTSWSTKQFMGKGSL